MITEDEAFWAGIAVAIMMLGGGFSMLFLNAFTGYGAVVLALGLMTMSLTIQMRAKPLEYVEPMTSLETRVFTPTSPVETTQETLEEAPAPQPFEVEDKAEAPVEHVEPSPPVEENRQVEPAEEATPTELIEQKAEQTQLVEPTEESVQPTEPIRSSEQQAVEPVQHSEPEVPIEEKTEPQASEERPEEKPKEEPQVTASTT